MRDRSHRTSTRPPRRRGVVLDAGLYVDDVGGHDLVHRREPGLDVMSVVQMNETRRAVSVSRRVSSFSNARFSVPDRLRRHLGTVFRMLAEQKESRIEEGHLMIDHVHMLISSVNSTC